MGSKERKKMSTVRSVEAAAASQAVNEALDLAAGNAGSVTEAASSVSCQQIPSVTASG